MSFNTETSLYTRDFENGDWVSGTTADANTPFALGLVADFDEDDGQYSVVLVPSNKTEPWQTVWANHELEAPQQRPPTGSPGHVFLVGAAKALTGVQVYADVATLVASYPNEGEHALEAVADPDEPVGKVRFAIVKGAR